MILSVVGMSGRRIQRITLHNGKVDEQKV